MPGVVYTRKPLRARRSGSAFVFFILQNRTRSLDLLIRLPLVLLANRVQLAEDRRRKEEGMLGVSKKKGTLNIGT